MADVSVATEEARCVNHRRTPTQLRCGRCEASICHRCIVHAPGGMRCQRCSRHEGGRPARRNRALLMVFGLITAGVVTFYTVVGLGEFLGSGSDQDTAPDGPGMLVAGDLPAEPSTSARTDGPSTAPPPLEIRGGTAVAEGWGEVTLHLLEIGPSRDDLTVPPGAVLTVADVEVCVDGELVAQLTRSDFYLQMTDNTRAAPRPGPISRAPFLGEVTLLGGDCVRGYLTFDVPSGRSIRSFNFEVANPMTGEVGRVWWTLHY